MEYISRIINPDIMNKTKRSKFYILMNTRQHTYYKQPDWTKKEHDSRKYSGLIFNYDFEIGLPTKTPLKESPLSRRIAACWSFDYACKIRSLTEHR